ncbi:MAG: ABC transporter permease [Betaproteobacteria bacterium]
MSNTVNSTALSTRVRRARLTGRVWGKVACGVGLSVLLGLLLLWPLARVLTYPTLSQWAYVLKTERWAEALWHSIVMAALVGVSATVLGFAYAYAAVRVKVFGRGLLHFLALLPILAPPFVVSISYILLFGRNGLITNKLLDITLNIYGWKGLWLVETVTFFPLAYLTLANVLRSIPGNLEQAASNMGASKIRVFWDVTLPLSKPGLTAALLLVGISVLADFGNPVIIAGDYSVLPTLAYMKITGWYDLAAAAVLASLLLVPTIALFAFQRMWLGKRSYVTISGKVSAQAHPAPPRWLSIMTTILAYAAGFAIVAVYGILAYGAFSRAWGFDYSPTLRNFVTLARRMPALIHTMEYSFAAAILSVVLATIVAYLVSRRRLPVPAAFDFVSTVPGAVPGIILGLGYVVAFNSEPLRLTGTPLIIILALALWNLPTAYRYVSASLAQLSAELENAAANMGANPTRSVLDVTVPLLGGALLSGGTVTFLRNVTCLSVVIFLVTPRTTMATTDILALVDGGEWGIAAALSFVLLAIALMLLSLGVGILKRMGQGLEL